MFLELMYYIDSAWNSLDNLPIKKPQIKAWKTEVIPRRASEHALK